MFDNETMFSIAAYGVIVSGLGLALMMAVRIWRKRPHRRVAVVLKPVSLTPEQEADLYTSILALERVITTLEQEEVVEWRTQYSVVEEAELIAEQYLHQLETRED